MCRNVRSIDWHQKTYHEISWDYPFNHWATTPSIVHIVVTVRGCFWLKELRIVVYCTVNSVLGSWLRAKAFSNINSNSQRYLKFRFAYGVIDIEQLNNKWKSYTKRLCYAKQYQSKGCVSDTACKLWHRMHIAQWTNHLCGPNSL
jgi:hypothetical protein